MYVLELSQLFIFVYDRHIIINLRNALKGFSVEMPVFRRVYVYIQVCVYFL